MWLSGLKISKRRVRIPVIRANHVCNCARLQIICYALRSAPVEQSQGTGRRSEGEEPERASGNDPVELVLRRRGPTPTGDAFTYLMCNNLEKVLTMVRGSPRFERKVRRRRDETRLRGSGVRRERSADEPSEISKNDTEVTSENGCSLSFPWNSMYQSSKLSFNEICPFWTGISGGI